MQEKEVITTQENRAPHLRWNCTIGSKLKTLKPPIYTGHSLFTKKNLVINPTQKRTPPTINHPPANKKTILIFNKQTAKYETIRKNSTKKPHQQILYNNPSCIQITPIFNKICPTGTKTMFFQSKSVLSLHEIILNNSTNNKTTSANLIQQSILYKHHSHVQTIYQTGIQINHSIKIFISSSYETIGNNPSNNKNHIKKSIQKNHSQVQQTAKPEHKKFDQKYSFFFTRYHTQ